MRFVIFLLSLLSILPSLQAETKNDSCQTALPFCGNNIYTFPAGVSSGSAQTGPDYDCLGSQPNPAWYYMQIDNPGLLIIDMYSTPSHDIDFCCWGPFPSPTGACEGGLTTPTVVDCSYSNSSTETCTIPGAQTGEFYILLITNFSNLECDITFSQTNFGQPGAGSTNCTIVIECSIVSVTATPSPCSGTTNTFNVSGSVEFSNPPPTGTLVVTDMTSTPHISQTFNAPFTSPTPFNLLNIPCDGLQHTLTAAFSDSATCFHTVNYQAPDAICPTAHITGGGSVCDYPGATVNVAIHLTGVSPWDFTWAIDGIPQTPVTNYSGPTPYIIATATPGTYTMVSVSSAACPGTVNGSATVTVNPLPVVTLDPFPATCLNTTPWTLSGGSPAAGVYSGNGVSGGIFNPSAAGTGAHEIVYSFTDALTCTNSDTATILVNPNPGLFITTGPGQLCSGNAITIIPASNLPDSTFQWTASASSGAVSGYSGGTGDTIHQTLSNAGFTTETVDYTITSLAAGCLSDPQLVSITVFPVPNLSTTPLSKEICSGEKTAITLLSDVVGSTFTWTCTQSSGNIAGWSENPGPGSTVINQTLTLNAVVPDSVLYHITPGANNCQGLTTGYKVIVNPVPAISNPVLTDSVCSEQTTSITLTSGVPGTGFTWTAASGTGNITGFSDGSGDVIAQQLFNPDISPGSVIYMITPSTAHCTGDDTPFTLWVKPLPHLVNQPKAGDICNGQSTGITLLADITGAWFTWTAVASSPDVSGYSDQTTPATFLDQTLTNAGYVPEQVTYQVSPTAKGCTGPDSLYVVTIFPVPDMSNQQPSLAICSGESTGITLTSHVAGTLFTWTATGSSPSVSGFSDNTSPSVTLDQVLINAGNTVETVTYTITPKSNGCSGPDTAFTVTVFPVPGLSTTPLAKEICNNNATGIALTSNVTGTLFTWTASGSSSDITGFTNNSVPASLINDNLINSGSVNETATYRIVPHANGCSGDTGVYVVTVIPSPYLTNNPLTGEQCNNMNTLLNLVSNVAGTEFTWTATGSSAQITGYSNSAAPGTSIHQILVNSGFDTETVTYHITPENTSCSGSVTDFTVSVFPVPDLFFSPDGETVCEGLPCDISILSHVTGATFTWTATTSSPDLSGYSGGSGNLIAQTVSNAGVTVETVTYHVIPEANGCPPGNEMPVVLTVVPRPAVTSPATRFALCNNATTAISPEADVPGSTFSWRAFASSGTISGYSNGTGLTINQTLANGGYGIDSVTYRVAATANGCTGDSTDFVVTVYPVADVYFVPDGQSICSGQTTGLSLQSQVAGASFAWTATGSSPDLSGYGPGAGDTIRQMLYNSGNMMPEATYQVAPTANGCLGTTNEVSVTVNPLPVVWIPVCFDTLTTTTAQPFRLRGAIPSGGNFTGEGVAGSMYHPAIAGPGNHRVTYTYANDFGCFDSASITISVTDPGPFLCGDPFTDIRDNQTYPTVLIGSRCWMAANLNFGSVISTAQFQRDNCVSEKYCFDDTPANCTANGGLYQWNEVMRYAADNGTQGFCPPEWHIPSETDWNTLFGNYVSNGFAASALKYSGYSGFNVLLTGILFQKRMSAFGPSDGDLNSSIFWSSTLHTRNKAWAHGFNDVVTNREYTPSVSFYPALHSNAFSVRCLKD